MPAHRVYRLVSLFALVGGVGGCAQFKQTNDDITVSSAMPQPSAEERQWWAANREKARYVPGRGYYVEGTSGYFDENGRKLPSDPTSTTGLVVKDEESTLDKLKPASAKNTFKKMVGRGPNEPIARAAFDEAEVLFRQQKYKEAAEKYTVAYDRWPDSPLEEKALFMAAECYFFTDLYVDADDAYGLLIKKYAATEHLDKVIARRFAIARYWEQAYADHPRNPVRPNVTRKGEPMFDMMGHVFKIYERIRLDDPTGPLADDAIMATANAHFVRGHYEDADYHYSLLRTEYPKSEHQFQAHLLGLRAKLLRYQGPEYEGGPLVEAEELAKQLLVQFPTELGEEKGRIELAQKEIVAQRAMRDYQTAEYYHKNEYYGASKMYYAGIVDKYPETKLAAESKSKIESVAGKPDVPEGPLDFIVKAMPESKKNGPTIAAQPNTTRR
jgi:outer membrane protein assembly factor BamD (BamD/ComL family)